MNAFVKGVLRKAGGMLAVLSWLIPVSCGNDAGPWKLVWSEDFDGPVLDTAAWTRVPRGQNDWDNTMSLREDLVRFEDGQLVLLGKVNADTLSDPSRFVSAGIASAGTRSFRLARFEVRAKFNSARGFWPALWLMPQRDSSSIPDYAEMDIMEHLNADSLVYQTGHSGYSLSGHDETPPHYDTVPVDPDDWNVYAVEVHQDSVCFFVNDAKTFTYPRIVNDVAPEMNQFPYPEFPFYLILSNQVGGNWVGPVEASDLPTELRIDWVKVFQRRRGPRG